MRRYICDACIRNCVLVIDECDVDDNLDTTTMLCPFNRTFDKEGCPDEDLSQFHEAVMKE